MQGAQPLFNLLHPLIFYLYISNKNATHASVPLLPRSVGSISYFNYYYCFVRYEFQCLFFKAVVHKSCNVPFWTSVLCISRKFVRDTNLPKWRTNTLVTSEISWDWKLPFLRRRWRRFIDSPIVVRLCAHCSRNETFLNLSSLNLKHFTTIHFPRWQLTFGVRTIAKIHLRLLAKYWNVNFERTVNIWIIVFVLLNTRLHCGHFFHFLVAVCKHLTLHSSAKHWKRMSQLTYRLQQFYCQINFRISICMTWELREHRSLFYARDLQKLLLFLSPASLLLEHQFAARVKN